MSSALETVVDGDADGGGVVRFLLVPTRDPAPLTLHTCSSILYYSLERATATCALHNY